MVRTPPSNLVFSCTLVLRCGPTRGLSVVFEQLTQPCVMTLLKHNYDLKFNWQSFE
jgi:hypothetical protein